MISSDCCGRNNLEPFFASGEDGRKQSSASIAAVD
jgi:hypothetical protein